MLVKSIKIPDTNDVVELYLMDSSGNYIYLDTLQECWKEVNLIVAVFDVTRQETLDNVSKWVDLVVQYIKSSTANDNVKYAGVLVANKTDLEDRRVVSPKVGAEVAQQLGLLYFECSAKDFKDVENPFYYLANEWHKIFSETAESMD